MHTGRLHKWLISGPPLAYLLIFFAIPTLIMVVASFRHPGSYGGLAPLFSGEPGAAGVALTTDNYARFFTSFVYTELFLKSLLYALITTAGPSSH